MKCNTKNAIKLFGSDIFKYLTFLFYFLIIVAIVLGLYVGVILTVKHYPYTVLSIISSGFGIFIGSIIYFSIKNYIANLCKRSLST